MNGMNAQLWVVGICVALALAYTVHSALVKVKRVQAGGSACGGCSGDACGSGGGGGCGGGSVDGASLAATTQGTASAGVVEQPLRWHPPPKRAAATSGGASTPGTTETN
jgi:hypothetical protein